MKFKQLIILFLFFLYSNFTFSQNLSLEELLNLQKGKKKNIVTFFKEKAWVQDAKNDKKWIFKNPLFADRTEAIFTLQDENCEQNIVNYIMSDSLIFNTLKKYFSKEYEKEKNIFFKDSYIEDYIYKNLYLRFFEKNDPNQLHFYAIWIFAITDNWYLKKIDKFCFPKINDNSSENSIETNAEFTGGEKEKMKFITRNMEYPFSAMEQGIQGTVYVGFTVEVDGSIANIKILKGLDGGFNEEVLRLIKLMPKWKPATRDGKPIKVMYNMPMVFKLNGW